MKITRRQLRQIIKEEQDMLTTGADNGADILAKITGRYSEHLDDLGELIIDLISLSGRTVMSHIPCAIKHTAFLPSSPEEALSALEEYGLCVLEGSGLEPLRAKWRLAVEEKKTQENALEIREVTRHQLRQLIKKEARRLK
jgi:hypothetical protein